MGKISQYENLVRAILTGYEDTRSNDKLLYLRLLRAEGYNTKISLDEYLRCISGFPNYDSISRVRRKLQERFPELRPAKNEQIRRDEAENDFRAYARGEE